MLRILIPTKLACTVKHAVLLSGNVRFIPSLPEWKQRALRKCEMITFTKIFVKFASDLRPFWDASQTILFVDSEPVDGCPAADNSPPPLSSSSSVVGIADETDDGTTDKYVRLRGVSGAVRYAHKRGDRYTRGYYTV